jgi:hypothetical protein
MPPAGSGTTRVMGRAEDRAAQATPAEEPEAIHGMGVSSEHDQGEVQEVDSREQE